MKKKPLSFYKKKVIALLREAGLLKAGLEPTIYAMATAWWNLESINADIAELNHCVYSEKTAYGTRIQKNPLYDLAKDQLRWMLVSAKQLGLECSKLMLDEDEDPLVNLTKQITAINKDDDIIKPGDD